jgi:signal peptidase I
MAKRSKRRKTFPEPRKSEIDLNPYGDVIDADMASPGLFGFFRDVGVRETVESLLVAIVLALLFRAFECEAFIIPTGSMAPSLNGQHFDLECENCQLRYHSGTDGEQERNNGKHRGHSTHCPVCQYQTVLSASRKLKPDHQSNNGDRILVNKFVYDFVEPKRFDVIVFKNPNNGKQNYIKRLIGLPGDNLSIENGDIHLFDGQEGNWGGKQIARKPPKKLHHVLQVVDDTHHIGKYLTQIQWPSRWQDFSGTNSWAIEDGGEHPVFRTADNGDGEQWLRYRHFQPRKSEWATIESGSLPGRMKGGELPVGELIRDQYAYNDTMREIELSERYENKFRNPGFHWVGDIGLDCNVDVGSSSGKLLLDVVEGGVHFLCAIDVGTGKATLSTKTETSSKIEFVDEGGATVTNPEAETTVKGPGSYQIEYVNADDQIHLWVDGGYVNFDAATYQRNDVPMPYYSKTDAGDAEPLAVGGDGAKLVVQRLKAVRDIYYTSTLDKGNIDNESGWMNPDDIYSYLRTPELWSKPKAQDYFKQRKGMQKPMLSLKDFDDDERGLDQFLPMGDNSPNSLDGRFWNGKNYVERNLLIGRAAFVYWPHTVNKPFPYCPNFWEMGFIR